MLAEFDEAGIALASDDLGEVVRLEGLYYKHTFFFENLYSLEGSEFLYEPMRLGNLTVVKQRRSACYRSKTLIRAYIRIVDDDGNELDRWHIRLAAAERWNDAFSQIPFAIEQLLQRLTLLQISKPSIGKFDSCVGVEVESLYEPTT